MKKYIVSRSCHGYKGRMWDEGQIVELEDGSNPPRHFQLIDENSLFSNINKKSEEERIDPMKPVPIDLAKPFLPATPKGGFAASQSANAPKSPVTAGQALKDKK